LGTSLIRTSTNGLSWTEVLRLYTRVFRQVSRSSQPLQCLRIWNVSCTYRKSQFSRMMSVSADFYHVKQERRPQHEW
jgi:hypothetical protein